jgi:hypothetical protein
LTYNLNTTIKGEKRIR